MPAVSVRPRRWAAEVSRSEEGGGGGGGGLQKGTLVYKVNCRRNGVLPETRSIEEVERTVRLAVAYTPVVGIPAAVCRLL